MNVYFGQIYVQPGVSFPFTAEFQKRLSHEVTALVVASSAFNRKFGEDWSLIFRISAKRAISETEIRGPTVFKKDKDVEFTVFLPFDEIQRDDSISRSALKFLLRGVCQVLESTGLDSSKLQSHQANLLEGICSDPAMFSTKS